MDHVDRHGYGRPPMTRDVRNHGYGGYSAGCRCDVCKAAKSAYARERRAAGRAARPRQGGFLLPCGTAGAYARHHDRGEPIDRLCRDGRNARARDLTRQHRAERVAAELATEALLRRHEAEYKVLFAAALAEEMAS